MTYASLQSMITRYGLDMLVGLTDRAQPQTGQLNGTVVERALEAADQLINGFVGGRYVLPLVDVPPLLSDLAEAIAAWKLHPYKPDEKIAEDYKDALRTLRDISDGKITLAVPSTSAPATVEGSGARLTDRERPLTAENLKGYI